MLGPGLCVSQLPAQLFGRLEGAGSFLKNRSKNKEMICSVKVTLCK